MRGMLWGSVMVVIGTSACATVHLTKRDGCWVRQTETFPKTIREEIGPCARPEPRWSEDRLARLVQECVAEADYRWENESLAAWNKGLPLPPQASEQTLMQTCMNDAATGAVSENESLRKRLADLIAERDSLRSNEERSVNHLRESEDRMTDALGEAAKKPAPSAFATSTSSGTATDSQSPSPSTSVTVTSPPLPAVPTPLPERVPRVDRPALRASCTPDRRRTTSGGGEMCATPATQMTVTEYPLAQPPRDVARTQ